MDWRKLARVVPPLVDVLFELYRGPEPKLSSAGPPPVPFVHSSTDEGYCLECLHKHINTANVLIREALQRYDSKESQERVLEKVRAAVAELVGAEDDSKFSTGRVAEINNKIRELRRYIWEKGYEFEVPSRDALMEIGDRVQKILKDLYDVAAERRSQIISFVKGIEEKARRIREELEEK